MRINRLYVNSGDSGEMSHNGMEWVGRFELRTYISCLIHLHNRDKFLLVFFFLDRFRLLTLSREQDVMSSPMREGL